MPSLKEVRTVHCRLLLLLYLWFRVVVVVVVVELKIPCAAHAVSLPEGSSLS